MMKDLPRKAFHRGLCPELQKVLPHQSCKFNWDIKANHDKEVETLIWLINVGIHFSLISLKKEKKKDNLEPLFSHQSCETNKLKCWRRYNITRRCIMFDSKSPQVRSKDDLKSLHIDVKSSSSQGIKPIFLWDLTQFLLVCPDHKIWFICICIIWICNCNCICICICTCIIWIYLPWSRDICTMLNIKLWIPFKIFLQQGSISLVILSFCIIIRYHYFYNYPFWMSLQLVNHL